MYAMPTILGSRGRTSPFANFQPLKRLHALRHVPVPATGLPASSPLATTQRDQRSRKVIFLSHCLLNENTRYVGGACRPAAVDEVVTACQECQLGIVQMPCPEQIAWGGVLKPWLLSCLRLSRKERLSKLHRPALWLFLRFTRRVYRRIAKEVARQIADYQRADYDVIGIVGVDGSPSCGVHATLDIARFLRQWMFESEIVQPDDLNALVTECATSGQGIFVEELQRQLQLRRAGVSWFAHDLMAELRGEACPLRLNVSISSGHG